MKTRRHFFKTAGRAIALVLAAPACKKAQAFSCNDTRSLSEDDMLARAALTYVDAAPDPSRACQACQQYVRAASDGCGGCKVMKGPVHPNGTCKVFTPKS